MLFFSVFSFRQSRPKSQKHEVLCCCNDLVLGLSVDGVIAVVIEGVKGGVCRPIR